jgi:predicted Na+-dependent transporter
MIFLAFILFVLIVPLLLGQYLARRCVNWTRFKIISLAAAPVPALVAVSVLFLATLSSTDEGIEMAVFSAIPRVAVAMFLYVLSMGLAAIAVFFVRRGAKGDDASLNDTFR